MGNFWEGQKMIGTAQRGVELQTEALERRVSAWDTKLDIYIEAWSSKYREADEEFTELLATVDWIHARTTAVKGVKQKQKQNAPRRLRAISAQVKAERD